MLTSFEKIKKKMIATMLHGLNSCKDKRGEESRGISAGFPHGLNMLSYMELTILLCATIG
jgi:hypothetical protein